MNRKFKMSVLMAIALAAFTIPFFTKAEKREGSYWLILGPDSWVQYTNQSHSCDGEPGPCLMFFPGDANPDDDGLEAGIPQGEEEGYAVLTQ